MNLVLYRNVSHYCFYLAYENGGKSCAKLKPSMTQSASHTNLQSRDLQTKRIPGAQNSQKTAKQHKTPGCDTKKARCGGLSAGRRHTPTP